MLSKIQRVRRGEKPEKPYPEFPLTANGNGQWSKKIRGKVFLAANASVVPITNSRNNFRT